MKLNIENYSQIGATTLRSSRVLTVDNAIELSEDIPAGVAGVAGAAGVMTLAEGHGITDADTVSVSWASGERHDCAVSAYDSTTITVNGATGAGNTLPTSGAVTVSVKTVIQASVNADNLAGMGFSADISAIASVHDGSGELISPSFEANSGFNWDSDGGETNPLAGEAPTLINVYNKGTTAGTFQGFYAYDNA